jgi:hypothetical protein
MRFRSSRDRSAIAPCMSGTGSRPHAATPNASCPRAIGVHRPTAGMTRHPEQIATPVSRTTCCYARSGSRRISFGSLDASVTWRSTTRSGHCPLTGPHRDELLAVSEAFGNEQFDRPAMG